jgi:DNA phosphorothioation-dependent restriction protein DptH
MTNNKSMFGVGMILSTQNLSDFKSAKMDYSSFIGSWIIHYVNNISRAEIANIFGAADSNYQGYMDFITNAKKFESICKLGNTIVGIRDLPYFELIQSDERFINLN